jgi:NAD(P)-dependent dehydrogenase (short-subunit alcohol dehydrogenase family)
MSGEQHPAPIKVAFVTGAGSGIGRSVALGLCQDGYHVALFGRTPHTLEATQAAAPDGATTMVLAGDVGRSSDVRAAFAEVKRHWNRLDLLFNNAGTSGAGRIDEISDERWERVIRTNLTGTFNCAREAFRLMREQHPRGGRIINNGSISATVPRPASTAYTATKHAITGLTKSISLDGRPYDIACGQIDIGNADTDMAAPLKRGTAQADGTVREEPVMKLEGVVDAVRLMARLPLEANVQFMTIMPTKMPLIGRG